ncbi:MAG: AbrB/MazE/SpoVT family DNA-binding domain-containing protein [Nostoc sp. DedQUE08]|uniref:antitoxin n=1 Tax=Nostoc sp. DedQUE08 TaxID=3075393 RepID=UPI002AD23B1E|nr:AbrB/MazE/SpoVT family DNA-binding domain-containing protein [Nostoc sp. DedQUE08]MDZ8069308.1 AbrB/MazE/SpoVT family DNA-binding domain-containing protein [Nostoc sp. DedQUE08]
MNTAKLSTDGIHQVVILPEDCQLTGTEVYIKKIGNAIVLIAKDNPWRSLIDSLDNFCDDFMTNCDRSIIDTRENWVE